MTISSSEWHFVGIILEIIGVALGTYSFREIIFKKNPLTPIGFLKSAEKLLNDPKTGKEIPQIVFNPWFSAISVSLILIGLSIQAILSVLEPF